MTQAVAVREDQHPIIAQIDAKMPEIAGMLPDGMRPERFRKVVVQALLRNPDLWNCTPVSVVTAITEAAEVGIEPTGVLGKGWLLPYNVNVGTRDNPTWQKQAKFIPGWRGFVDLLWRADRLLVTPEIVREGDEFEYRRGTGQYLHHIPVYDEPDREADDLNITHAYVIVRFPDGREDFEVMSLKAIEAIRDRAKKKNPVWDSDFAEMAKKTPIRRIAKRLPLSPAAQRMLAGDEEVDFDTPVERVPDHRREGLRDRISQRTAALRGGASEESDASGLADAPADGAEEAGSSAPASGSSPRGGDPWMRRLHAVAAERGMDHDDLHDWAVQHFQVASLSDLIPGQRATFMELVERMPLMPQSAEVPSADVGEAEEARSSASPDIASSAAPLSSPGEESPAAPSMEDVLRITGGEEVPPKPGTKAYRDLPSGTERATAKAYWDKQKAEPQQESLAEQFGAPPHD